MKFRINGIDIPDELVAAQENGDVIFICGAGISMPSGLPDFRGLVQHVYEALGEDWVTHPDENAVMQKEGRLYGQYDRGLRILERRLVAGTPVQKAATRKLIRDHISNRLVAKPNANIEGHKAILKLSLGKNGTVRTVTTNFDTLFERAYKELYGESVASHAGQALPGPGGTRFGGIMHLHGRIAERTLGLEETDLVLTSAEFGDAYLRSNWATQFIYDLSRTHAIVLIGYEADDPPMRYLMETLEASRDRFPDLKDVYAMANTKDDPALEGALWRAKGIKPILFVDTEGHPPFQQLYEGLDDWAAYAADPTQWRINKLAALFALEPDEVSPEDFEEIAFLLEAKDAISNLSQVDPDPAWMKMLIAKGIIKNETLMLVPWASKHLDDPKIISAMCAIAPLSRKIVDWLRGEVRRQGTSISAGSKRAWETILEATDAQEYAEAVEQAFWLETQIPSALQSKRIANLVGAFIPKLVVREPIPFLEDEGGGSKDLVRLDFECSVRIEEAKELRKIWEKGEFDRTYFLKKALEALNDSLRLADAVGFISPYDQSSADVASVSDHHQNAYRGGYMPLIRIIADVFASVASEDPANAKSISQAWFSSNYTLEQRLYAYALTFSDIYAAADAYQWLLELHDLAFWGTQHRREIYQLLEHRWPDFNEKQKAHLIDRVVLGPTSDEYDKQNPMWDQIKDHETFAKLSRLKRIAGNLNETGEQRFLELTSQYPDWTSSDGDRDDFSSWHGMVTGFEGDIAKLDGFEGAALVQEALRVQQEERFNQGNLWRTYCASDPKSALSALVAYSETEWSDESWSDLLSAVYNVEDTGLQQELASKIIELSANGKLKRLQAAVSWFGQIWRQLLLLGSDNYGLIFNLWDELASKVYADERPAAGGDDKHLYQTALNATGGTLVRVLIEILRAQRSGNGKGIEPAIKTRMEKAIQADNRSGLMARANVIYFMTGFHAIDPIWAEREILPLLRIGAPEFDELWKVLLSGPQLLHGELLRNLKSDVKALFRSGDIIRSQPRGLATQLMWALNGYIEDGSQNDLSFSEAKAALNDAGMPVMDEFASIMWRRMRELRDEAEPLASQKRKRLFDVLKAVWPLDRELRHQAVSHDLIHFALDAKELFAEVISFIDPLIVPTRHWAVRDSHIRRDAIDEFIKTDTKAVLVMLDRMLDHAITPPIDLKSLLDACVLVDQSFEHMPEYVRLRALSRRVV